MINEKILNDWDEQIRQGQGEEVLKNLDSLSSDRALEKHYPKLLNLCRRTGAYSSAFSLCNRFYHDHSSEASTQPAFYLEYAAVLSEVGAVSIAAKIFAQFPEHRYRWQSLYQALHKMKIWDFETAEKHLTEYLSEETEDYWITVARLNLVFCQVFNRRLDPAQEILSKLLKTKAPDLILGTAHEQLGEVQFLKGDFAGSQKSLLKASDILKNTGNPVYLFARKWQLILALKQAGQLPDDWQSFRDECLRKGFWEILRDMDRYRAVILEDQELLGRVYFGTPHTQYRKQLLRDTQWTPPDEWVTGKNQTWIWSRQKAQLFQDSSAVALPDLFRRLIQCLSADLYKQNATGFIFDSLYPADHFHPDFARQRIYSLMSRFRGICSEKNIPLAIESHNLGFQLPETSEVAVEFSHQQQDIKWDLSFDEKIEILLSHFGTQPFSASEAASILNIPKRTLNRVLTLAVETGSLERTGQSRNVRYQHPST